MKKHKRKISLRTKRMQTSGFPNKNAYYIERDSKLWFLVNALEYQDYMEKFGPELYQTWNKEPAINTYIKLQMLYRCLF